MKPTHARMWIDASAMFDQPFGSVTICAKTQTRPNRLNFFCSKSRLAASGGGGGGGPDQPWPASAWPRLQRDERSCEMRDARCGSGMRDAGVVERVRSDDSAFDERQVSQLAQANSAVIINPGTLNVAAPAQKHGNYHQLTTAPTKASPDWRARFGNHPSSMSLAPNDISEI